jgi:hypothetical protein
MQLQSFRANVCGGSGELALPVEALNPGTAPKIARAGEELRFFPIPDNFGSSLQHTFLYQ